MVTRKDSAQVVIPDATAEPAAYVRALLEVLGDRDPVRVLAETPNEVDAIIAKADITKLDRSPEPGTEWSFRDVLGHLLDVDIVYGFRLRLALTAEAPTYPGYDEKAFSKLPKLDVAGLASAFRSLRAANLAFLEQLTADQLARQGVHGEQGLENVDLMVKKLAGHDLAHLAQMRRAAPVAGDGVDRHRAAEDLLRAAEQAFAAKDLDAICDLFTDDVVARYAGQPEIRGRAQLREHLRSRLDVQIGYAPKKTLLLGERDLIVDAWTGAWTDRDTGAAMAGRGIEVLRLRHGKVAELDAAFVSWASGPS
jgi:ketosteroid isomerase-like protein